MSHHFLTSSATKYIHVRPGNEGWQKRPSSGKEAMYVPNQTVLVKLKLPTLKVGNTASMKSHDFSHE